MFKVFSLFLISAVLFAEGAPAPLSPKDKLDIAQSMLKIIQLQEQKAAMAQQLDADIQKAQAEFQSMVAAKIKASGAESCQIDIVTQDWVKCAPKPEKKEGKE